MLNSEYVLDVIQSFEAVQNALSQLQPHLVQKDNKLPCWFQPPVDLPSPLGSTDRAAMFGLIRQCEYLDHQKPRDILVGAGIVAASQETLQALHTLNLAKDHFKAAMLALKAAKIPTTDPQLSAHFEQALGVRPELTTHILAKVGLPRLHLKQCYRRIPILPLRPHKVSWTWANTKAITRITVAQAEQLLLKHSQDAGILNQLNKLKSLSPNAPLAIVQELAPHLRANIVLPTPTGATTRIMVKGPVPLFYAFEENLSLPHLRPAGEKQGKDRNRPIRSDVKLDPEPFLPAIRVHRYLHSA
jgi:hypothetical protein